MERKIGEYGIEEAHARFGPVLGAVEAHACAYLRGCTDRNRREEFLQACRALAWEWFASAVRRGKAPWEWKNGLARRVVRAARSGRNVGQGIRSRDVMYRWDHGRPDGEVIPLSPSGVIPTGTQEAYGPIDGRGTPDQLAALRVDLGAFLRLIRAQVRTVGALAAQGCRTGEIAAALGVTQSRVSQVRREWVEDWNRWHEGGMV